MRDDQKPEETDQNEPQPAPWTPAQLEPTSQQPLEPLSSPDATDATLVPPAHKKKRIALLLIAVLAVIVVAAGSAAAYFGYVVPNNPENMLKSALGNALTQQAGQSKGELEISGQDTSLVTTFDGAFDAEQKVAQLAFELTTSGLSLPAEVRYVDESIFVKIGDVSALRTLAQLTGLDDESLDEIFATAERTVVDKWIEIDKTILQQEDEAKCIVEADWTLSEGDAALLQEAYAQHEFVTIKSHSDDTVDGRGAIKYELEIDAAKAEQFGDNQKLEELSVFKRLNDCAPTATEEDADDQVTDGLENATLTVWVDKDTKRFSRYAVTATSEGTEFTVDATLGYEPVTVAKPEGATPIMDVIAEFQSSFPQDETFEADMLGVFDDAGMN